MDSCFWGGGWLFGCEWFRDGRIQQVSCLLGLERENEEKDTIRDSRVFVLFDTMAWVGSLVHNTSFCNGVLARKHNANTCTPPPKYFRSS